MPNMSKYLKDTFPKNLSIDIGVKVSFRNYKKIEEWIHEEIMFYKSIGNPGNGVHTITQNIKNNLPNKFNQNRNTNYTEDAFFLELKNLIEPIFLKQGLVSARSKEGKYLSRLFNINSSLVPGALIYFQQKKQNNNSTITQRNGEFAAYLFDNGIEPNFQEEKLQYSNFYDEITHQKDELLAELKVVKDVNTTLNKEIEEQKAEWSKNFSSQKEEVSKRFDDEYARHQSKMKKTEDFYEKELAVKSAVTYWTNKAKTHKVNSIIAGAIAGVLMIITLLSLFSFGRYILTLDVNDDTGKVLRILTKDGALQLWVYGFFLISATIALWVIRIIVKIFLSNLHLLSDAKERETMIQTYLAFEREDKVLNKEDKGLILPSIFRVSANGIIKEDSGPATPMNILLKSMKG